MTHCKVQTFQKCHFANILHQNYFLMLQSVIFTTVHKRNTKKEIVYYIFLHYLCSCK